MLAVAIVVSSCGGLVSFVPDGVDPRPWDQPVAGEVATTAWSDDGQPGAPFGSGDRDWAGPQQLIDAMSRALAEGGAGTRSALASENESGTVVGWVRITDPNARPSLASDLRIEMRSDGGSWFVVRIESRTHCAEPLEAGACR